MSNLEVGDFLAVKDYIKISSEKIPISYVQVVRDDGRNVGIEFYDHQRRSVCTKELEKIGILASDKFQNTVKNPAKIALEFRREKS